MSEEEVVARKRTPREQRRLRRLIVPKPTILLTLCFRDGIEDERVRLEGDVPCLPEDTETEDLYLDCRRNAYVLIVSSREFSPVPDGDIIPLLPELTQVVVLLRRRNDEKEAQAKITGPEGQASAQPQA